MSINGDPNNEVDGMRLDKERLKEFLNSLKDDSNYFYESARGTKNKELKSMYYGKADSLNLKYQSLWEILEDDG